MPSTEVQRTLVKSPPELWAELSDPAALARHLGDLGEIHLTRVEPESAVEWEAEEVKGSVQLKASGWGTKVTFSLTRELPEPPAAQEPEPTTAEAASSEAAPSEAAHEQLAPEPALPEPTEPAPAEPEPADPAPMAEPEPTPRRGFFARLFRRRRAEPTAELVEPLATSEPVATAEPVTAPEPVAATPEPVTGLPEPVTEPPEAIAEPPDLAAGLAAMEQAMVEQDTALLTAVLDRLGAAHHRPFSRG